jgi:hypothetical protein
MTMKGKAAVILAALFVASHAQAMTQPAQSAAVTARVGQEFAYFVMTWWRALRAKPTVMND